MAKHIQAIAAYRPRIIRGETVSEERYYVVHTGNVIYTLSITLDGRYEINVKLKKHMAQALNAPGAFRGKIANAENIGKSSDELVEMWNEKHSDDLIGG